MAEVLVRYTAVVRDGDGKFWIPQACGGVAKDGLWEGWIEFVSDDRAIRTGRETEQPNRDAIMYWAQGLTSAYLEGALARATTTRTIIPREPRVEVRVGSRFQTPGSQRPARGPRPTHAVLDPFSIFAQGEELLRGQLSALSHDNLVAIVEDYALPVRGVADMRRGRLVDEIVEAVRASHSTKPPAADAAADDRPERRP